MNSRIETEGKMRAIYLEKHGGIDVLKYGELPIPEPGAGEVRLRLRSAALNHLDIWVRAGWPGIGLRYPFIPGADGAGEVEKVGSGVTGWSPGMRVVINPNLSCGVCSNCLSGFENRCMDWGLLGETRSGTYAQYIVVPVENIYSLPDYVDTRVAASAALVYQTAWHSLVARGKIKGGESVLVVGASGGVNTASIQIAKLAGAIVYVVGSSDEKLALANELGADYLINRARYQKWYREVLRLTGGRGVDIVIDNVGSTFPMSMRAATKGGRILTVGNTGGAKFEIDNRFVFAKHLSIIGSTMSPRHDFITVMDLVFQGKLSPMIDRVYALEHARQAQERLQNGEQMGKIVLDIP
jgi:NADPH:quinone reductase-like Zn-dependent oxidoreductase